MAHQRDQRTRKQKGGSLYSYPPPAKSLLEALKTIECDEGLRGRAMTFLIGKPPKTFEELEEWRDGQAMALLLLGDIHPMYARSLWYRGQMIPQIRKDIVVRESTRIRDLLEQLHGLLLELLPPEKMKLLEPLFRRLLGA